ncbi:MAG TPA: Hsp20/alpha crystallin family protein [Chromatiales bacterium]|nr:Hsp20/alpha crystallin family protein [Chromatiales bacterium]
MAEAQQQQTPAEAQRQEAAPAEEGRAPARTGQKAPARAVSPFEEMERLFEQLMPRGWLRPFRMEWPSLPEWRTAFEMRMPRVDVIDRDKEVVVRAEVPGVRREDLEVSVADSSITIRGQTSREETEEKGEYVRRERVHGEFSRTVTLPAEVDPDRAQAKFRDGVLEVTIPKVERARRRVVQVE